MSLLVAVKSCQMHREYHQAIRDTWGRHLETIFFMGGSTGDHSFDEVILNCPDDYLGLPFKTQAICKFVLDTSIDYLFFADTDTFIIPERLLKSGFENFDYVGRFGGNIFKKFYYEAPDREGRLEIHPECYPWASGGLGYFLSRKAFSIIAQSEPTSWAEDLGVGQIIGPLAAIGELKILDITNQRCSRHRPHFHNADEIKTANWMKQMYQEHSPWR